MLKIEHQGIKSYPLSGLNGIHHLPLKAVGSTTDECLNLFKVHSRQDFQETGIKALWVTGESQSKGRGRLGRQWVSKPGNLYASLLLLAEISPKFLATLPFVSVLAAYNTIAPLLPKSSRCEIKWPNDLLINDKKISGILLESHTNSHQEQAIIIGCGINIAHFPDEAQYPTTSLHHESVIILPEQLFLMLAKEMANLLEVWDKGRGFEKIKTMWLSHAKGIGATLRVKINNTEEIGIFEGIDEQGCLLLDTLEKGLIKISAGDIFFSQ